MTEGKSKSKKINNMADVVADPNLAAFADDIAPLLVNEKTIPYQKSYLLAQQAVIVKRMNQLHQENPSLPLKTVLTKILNEIPENVSSPLLMELTNFTITYWESLPQPSTVSTH